MKRFLAILGIALILGVAGFTAFVWFQGGSGESSRSVLDEIDDAPSPSPAPEGESQPDTAHADQAGPGTATDRLVYTALPGDSEARFIIEEVLRGEPVTVVGTTTEMAGTIAVTYAPAEIEIGTFAINLRTLRTDNEMRDRTIRSLILQTNQDQFEFARFEPARIDGVPGELAVGDQIQIQVTGSLTVRGVASDVTFAMNIFLESEDRISGQATSRVTWEQFDLSIPYVGGDSIVQAVDDELGLELDFVGVR